jgi:hypothetical protein
MEKSAQPLSARLLPVGIALTLAVLAVAFWPNGANEGHSFSGEIMDSQCAQLGSHQKMMADHNFTTALQCALFCARVQAPAGKFVLFDKSKNRIYLLDNQEQAELYASEKVTISGNYDAGSKTLQITSIEAKPQ